MSEIEKYEETEAEVAERHAEFLTFDQIMSAQDVTEKVVPVPEWGGDVLVKSLTKRQFDGIRKGATNSRGDVDDDKIDMLIFCSGMIQPQITAEQYEALRDRSIGAWRRVLDAIRETSSIGEEAGKAEDRFPA